MTAKRKTDRQNMTEPVYYQNMDTQGALHQIVQDMKEEANKEMYNKWDISWKDLKSCNIKTPSQDVLELHVNELHGALRLAKDSPHILEKRAKDTLKLLEKFEKALKKQFKEKTGRTLSLSKGKTICNYELVALNGLYRFFAIKVCDLKTDLGGQEYKDSLKNV